MHTFGVQVDRFEVQFEVYSMNYIAGLWDHNIHVGHCYLDWDPRKFRRGTDASVKLQASTGAGITTGVQNSST